MRFTVRRRVGGGSVCWSDGITLKTKSKVFSTDYLIDIGDEIRSPRYNCNNRMELRV